MLASSPSEFYPVLAVKLARNLLISSQQSAISGAFVPGLMGGESRHLLIKKGSQGHARFQRDQSMVKGSSTHFGDLQSNVGFSQSRALWPDKSPEAVSSILPANIAEGFGRGGNIELARFLQIAMGSATEVEYHILLARDLSLLTITLYENLNGRVVEVKRMLASLLLKVRRDQVKRVRLPEC
jgi:four helix bundle protein